jgi:hypothetical protein
MLWYSLDAVKGDASMRLGVPVTCVAVVATAALSVAAAKTNPRPWQKLNLPTVAQVRGVLADPPPEYGPEPYYGLNGPATIETVQRDLDTMKSLGFHAVTVQCGYGSYRRYLSPEWFAFFKQFVAEAKKRDMRVWIVDDAGYPSGFAGGKFTSEHPELRMQALVVAKKVALSAAARFDESVTPDTVAVTAVRAGDGRTVQVPVKDGRATWTATDGEWTVYVVEHAFRTSPTRSDTNPKRVKDSEQSLEDYLDPAATAKYLAFTHEAYKKAVGDEFGKTIMGFRGDEPDFSISGLPWTPKLFAKFEAMKGYDVRPYVAVFLQGRDAVLTPEQLRARADYYDVFADMFRDGFFKPQGVWCAANGLEYQVHLNHEEMQMQLAHSEGDFFRDMQFVEVPGIDSIWHQIWTDTVSDFPRFASSAAHVYGHPRAFTESFAAYRPAPDVAMARYILNEQFVRGVNLVETMYFAASSTPGGGGPSALMRDAGWPALMQYTSRMSYLMSRGRPATEVALLLPAESLWMGDKKADDTFVSAERLLGQLQVEFDIVGEDAIGSQLTTMPGAFVSGSGNRYKTVIVPNAEFLPDSVVARLRTFAASGGKVLILGSAPEFVGGRNDLHSRKVTAEDFSWATVISGDLPVTPTPPAQPPRSAPEAMVVPPGYLEALKRELPVSDVALETPNTGVRVMTRRLKDARLVLLFNESSAALNDRLLVGDVAGAEEWNPQSGNSAAVKTVQAGGKTAVPLSLAPYATELLVLR